MVPKFGERVGTPVVNSQKNMPWLCMCEHQSDYDGSNNWMFAKNVDVRACEAISVAAKH